MDFKVDSKVNISDWYRLIMCSSFCMIRAAEKRDNLRFIEQSTWQLDSISVEMILKRFMRFKSMESRPLKKRLNRGQCLLCHKIKLQFFCFSLFCKRILSVFFLSFWYILPRNWRGFRKCKLGAQTIELIILHLSKISKRSKSSKRSKKLPKLQKL